MSGISVPIAGLVIAVFVLIFLVLRTKVHPLIAMIFAACIAGVTGGLSMKETINAITSGFGSTLGSIGIVIGLGVMMGRILEVSGAAEQIAYSFIKLLGRRKEEWSLAATGYLVSIPIFADSAFVILYPIAKALSKKGGRSLLTMVVALAGGLIVAHTLVPPTPGPLGVAGIFGVDIGAMMLMGLSIGIPCTLSFVLYAQWLAKKYPAFVPTVDGDDDAVISSLPEKKLPSLAVSLMPIVVPILLILAKALVNFFPAPDELNNPGAYWFVQVFDFIGTPMIALCISTLLAVYTLVPGMDKQHTSARLEEGLQSAGIILLVTGAGGALGFVVRESGAGTLLAEQIANLPFSPVMIPFFVASVVRLIQGSATVAMITSASITGPILAEIPDVNMLFAAQAAAIGGFLFSYFNDSLFWVVGKLMGISDVKVHITTWSVPTILGWAVGGILIALINLFFGTRGSLLDLLVPLIGLGIVVWVVRKR